MSADSCVTNPGHVHKRSPVTAPSSFTAVDKILGYKIASLNRVFESSPVEPRQLQLPEHDTWQLFTAWKCKKGATTNCFQIFVFYLLPKQWKEKFKLFHQVVFSSVFLFCFCFQAQELLKICIFENDYYFTCAVTVIMETKPCGVCVCMWVFCFSLAPTSSASAIATFLTYLAAELFKLSSTP